MNIKLLAGQEVQDLNGNIYCLEEGDLLHIQEFNTNIKEINKIIDENLLSNIFDNIRNYLWLSANPLFNNKIKKALDEVIKETIKMEDSLESVYFPQGYK